MTWGRNRPSSSALPSIPRFGGRVALESERQWPHPIVPFEQTFDLTEDRFA
jgi:hypothetical protein